MLGFNTLCFARSAVRLLKHHNLILSFCNLLLTFMLTRLLCNRHWRPDLVLLQCMGAHAQRSQWGQVGKLAAFSLLTLCGKLAFGLRIASLSAQRCTIKVTVCCYVLLLKHSCFQGGPWQFSWQGYWSTLSSSVPKFWLYMEACVAAVKNVFTVFIKYFH